MTPRSSKITLSCIWPISVRNRRRKGYGRKRKWRGIGKLGGGGRGVLRCFSLLFPLIREQLQYHDSDGGGRVTKVLSNDDGDRTATKTSLKN